MGMSIDKAIGLVQHNIGFYTDDGNNEWLVGFDDEDVEAYTMAMDCMDKFQQIQRIVKFNKHDGTIGRLVRELVEDGNDDNKV